MNDTQNSLDTRNIPIDQVGIKDLRYPIHIKQANGEIQTSIGQWMMTVKLPADKKGTHMSRFLEALHEWTAPIDYQGFLGLLSNMRERLQAQQAHICVNLPYFLEKQAPISKAKSYLDYEVTLDGTVEANKTCISLQVLVPVKSLCPCSKEISDAGAHNQRSHLTLRIELKDDSIWIDDLIRIAEAEASVEIYGLLKRADEKFVTERAYHNPKFVEDVTRDIALELKKDKRVAQFQVSAENFESIHNHSAYALINSTS